MLYLPWGLPEDEGNSGVLFSFLIQDYDMVIYHTAEIKKCWWSAPPQ